MPRTENGIHYEKFDGEGVPVIFIHGWTDSINGWSKVKEHLDIDNPKIFYDQRCHGDSICTGFNMDKLAEDLKQLIEEEELNNPLLAGHSLGGMTALKYISSFQNFSAVLLIGSPADTPEPVNENPRYFLEKLSEMDREKWAEKIVENYTGSQASRELKNSSQKLLEQTDEKTLRNGLEAMINYDVKNSLPSKVKAHVVGGRNDGAITEEKINETAELLNAEKTLLDSSHLMLQEKPEKIAELITDFTDKNISGDNKYR
ncbi:MAG: alpha/beta fold hydrolase [Candidatus Nanohalobium sp.]